tara:strand:+ start:429 stop:668 length:240 start_codon:yes stop_codon:yes gene_type:complete
VYDLALWVYVFLSDLIFTFSGPLEAKKNYFNWIFRYPNFAYSNWAKAFERYQEFIVFDDFPFLVCNYQLDLTSPGSSPL